ncbi:MAG: universal stress protein [Chloroflexota bacterium]|nr:universal stress protein [Chloroflexota bacterium]
MANQTILVPLDRGSIGECAIPLAASLARTLRRRLRILHAIPPVIGGDSIRAEFKAAADRYLSRQREVIREHHGISPLAVARFGPAAPTIVEEVEREREAISLIVMATSQRRGLLRQTLGSVAEEVIEGAPVPVVVVPAAHQRATERVPRVLLPIDGSACSVAILPPVAELAKGLRADVSLLHVETADIFGTPCSVAAASALTQAKAFMSREESRPWSTVSKGALVPKS